jgi:hypothetical protein
VKPPAVGASVPTPSLAAYQGIGSSTPHLALFSFALCILVRTNTSSGLFAVTCETCVVLLGLQRPFRLISIQRSKLIDRLHLSAKPDSARASSSLSASSYTSIFLLTPNANDFTYYLTSPYYQNLAHQQPRVGGPLAGCCPFLLDFSTTVHILRHLPVSRAPLERERERGREAC